MVLAASLCSTYQRGGVRDRQHVADYRGEYRDRQHYRHLCNKSVNSGKIDEQTADLCRPIGLKTGQLWRRRRGMNRRNKGNSLGIEEDRMG